MITPRERLIDSAGGRRGGQFGAPDHDDGKPKSPGRRDLGIAGIASAVLRHNDLDPVLLQKAKITRLGKRSTIGDVNCLGNGKRRVDRINTAHKIGVLWRGFEHCDVVSAKRNEYTARFSAQSLHGIANCRRVDPKVARHPLPRRAPQGEEWNVRFIGRLIRVGRDLVCKGVGCVNQYTDFFVRDEPRETFRTAESANARGYTLATRTCRETCQGQRHVKIAARMQRARKLTGFRRTAKNEDVHDRS